MGLFDKLKNSLAKTKESVSSKIEDVIKAFRTVDEDLLEELEEALIMADLGVNTSCEIIEKLRQNAKEKKITDSNLLKDELKQILVDILSEGDNSLKISGSPAVIMVIGVNGVGKTTSIGKMAYNLRSAGQQID